MIEAVSGAAVSSATNVRAQTPAIKDSSFADLMSNSAQSLVQSLQSAENMSAAGLTGDVGVRQVAETIMEAERNLQTAIAIRDKVVSAWLDVSRMAI